MSYESPLSIHDFVSEISQKLTEEKEKYIYQQIRTYVDVNKEELIKALQYDRDQYDKGYIDGLKDSVQVVRCKDCRYADDYYHDGSIYCCIPGKPMRWHDDDPNWFCADGKPKEGR